MATMSGRRRWPSFPIAVLLIGLVTTAAVATQIRQSAGAQDQERFEVAVDRLQDSIRDRLDLYTAMLRAGAGLLGATELHSPEQFRVFVDRLQVPQRYPGIQGIGYSERIPAADVRRIEAAQRQQGRAAFHVWPEDAREEYHAILYLEPLDRRNQAAIGYDMFTEPTRRAAMERARDTGEPTASGLVTLVQEIDEAKQPGFLIYMPVYDGGAVPPTVEDRRRTLRGFVYSPFRAGDLFSGILGRNPRPRAGFALYDGAPAPAALIHRTAVADVTGGLRATRTLDVGGRRWTAEMFSTAAIDRSSSARLVPFVWSGGGAITAILTVLALLQVRARERAERSEMAAGEASRQFQQLANAIPQLAWMARPDGWIYWYNERWYQYTGTTPEQMTGWGWQQVHDPEELPRVLERWAHSLAHGEPFEMEFPLRGADGTFRWFLTRMVPFRDSSGALVQWFGTNTDVQYRREAERRVEQLLASERAARGEAERVSRLKDEFLATLSHELRTPLNAIVGWAHMLSKGTLSDAKRLTAVQTIQRNARIQSQLIEDLLDMSAIISGRVRIHPVALEMHDIVSAALDVVGPTAAAKHIELHLHEDPGSHAVCGDSQRLQQVVWNLLTNAIKFTPAGGAVTVRLSTRDHQIELQVSDTGMGISSDFLPHVFERFRQADGSVTRGHGGLGLGLSIVKSLVEMHGGAIEASSPGLNQGATFTVRLPAMSTPAVSTTAAHDTDETDTSARSLQSLSILVVDDDADAGELAREILTEAGAEVSVARSAPDALRHVRAHGRRLGLVVSDIGMPGIDGYEFLRQVRALPADQGGRVPALALTAYVGADDRSRALAAGYDRHLAKPFTPAQLVTACATLRVQPHAFERSTSAEADTTAEERV